MKMVKSLLLGSAAGLVAMAGAQAADLPVKAKPVEYVKVCSLYGEGFFFIPGTDTCIKIGGWVRAEYITGGGGSHSTYISGAPGFDVKGATHDSVFRARTVISTDVRTQTEYGTLRAYVRTGFDHTTNQLLGGLYAERAFIQFAGFTFGKTQSYFDFFNGVFGYGIVYAGGGSATGFGGQLVAAYTAQFGNGISATISLEDATQRRNAVWDADQDLLRAGALPTPLTNVPNAFTVSAQNIGDYAAHQIPDIVASLRVDQAWGSAQIAAALHQVRGVYGGLLATNFGAGAVNNNIVCGQPGPNPVGCVDVDDKFGFAIMGGLVLNVPTGPGDKFWAEVTYSEGAPSYNGLSSNALFPVHNRRDGFFMAAGHALDAVYGTIGGVFTDVQLTQVLSVGAAFEHYWTPALRTSIFGTWNSIDYNATATTLYCTDAVAVVGLTSPIVPGSGVCNPDYRVWSIGSRTIWNPVRNLDVGLEVMYTRIDSDMGPTVLWRNAGAVTGLSATPLLASDESNLSAILRFQRNFWP